MVTMMMRNRLLGQYGYKCNLDLVVVKTMFEENFMFNDKRLKKAGKSLSNILEISFIANHFFISLKIITFLSNIGMDTGTWPNLISKKVNTLQGRM